jgi:parallel beta-helix repeat protein
LFRQLTKQKQEIKMNAGKTQLMMVALFTGLLAAASAQAFEFHVTTPQELQAALATAASNGTDDTVYLAAGTYVGNFRYRTTTEINSLTVKAEEGLSAEDVILDGNQNAYVLMFDTSQISASLFLEKLTIQNGRSTNGGGAYILTKGEVHLSGCMIMNNTVTGSGGGIYIKDASLTVFEDNTITGNSSASSGGGVYISSSSVTFTSNTIIGNSASFSGGGVYIYSFSVMFTSNAITGNSGGGVHIYSSSVTFTSNTITGNSSSSGGGVFIYSSSVTFTIINNIVSNNEVKNTGGKGGGIYIIASGMTSSDVSYLINNTITGNISASDAGGVYIKIPDTVGTLNVYNNIIWGNTASGTGGDIYLEGYGGETNLFNNVMTDMVGIWEHSGSNRTSNPLFFDAANGDYHLKTGSPCINAGTPSAPQLPTTDLEGNPREGNPDIGALEFFTSALHPADTNNNWIIEQTEFEAYRTVWKNGELWQAGSFLIPPSYLTRAGYLYLSGGSYHNTGANRPICWVPGQ